MKITLHSIKNFIRSIQRPLQFVLDRMASVRIVYKVPSNLPKAPIEAYPISQLNSAGGVAIILCSIVASLWISSAMAQEKSIKIEKATPDASFQKKQSISPPSEHDFKSDQVKEHVKPQPPTNFNISEQSSEVQERMSRNKKQGLPLFEGIVMALEFKLMDAQISESELVARIEKNGDSQTPIQLEKKEENIYWIITGTSASISHIKETVSNAGLTVNFISKSYRLK